jgi:AmmeMemoRadiSam system protein A
MLTDNQKKTLLKLARQAIATYLQSGEMLSADLDNLPGNLSEPQGTFVTLELDKQLRGCIGNLTPIEPIAQNVINNAINAAFKDPRFQPVTSAELQEIKIEISIISPLKHLAYHDSEDLLKKIKPGQGLIIHEKLASATFLPQVWQELPEKQDFLSHLCAKAGLSANAWKAGKLKVETYEVENFSDQAI